MYASAFYKCQDSIDPMWLLYFFLVTMFWELFSYILKEEYWLDDSKLTIFVYILLF